MKTYDAKDIILIVGGLPIDAGRDAGNFLSIAADTPEYTKTVGADGEVVVNRSNDRSRNVTITLMQSSLSNAALSGFLSTDRIAEGGVGYPFIMRHRGQLTTVVATRAKLTNGPGSAGTEYGQEVGTHQWELVLTGVREFYGGMTETPLAPI